MKDAHRRQAIADARLAEIRVERELGELVPRERFRTALRDAFHRVAARLRNLPPRLAGVAVGVKSTTEALARFEPLVDELFTELYAGDDVPMHEDE